MAEILGRLKVAVSATLILHQSKESTSKDVVLIIP